MFSLGGGLSKLIITGYREDGNLTKEIGKIAAMYNPASIELGYSNDYADDQFINQSIPGKHYIGTKASDLSLSLIFDAMLADNDKSVNDQLAQLRALCYDVDLDSREKCLLKIQWGNMEWGGNGHRYFMGRPMSLTLQYTLFDRDGAPLRATATLRLAAEYLKPKDIALPDVSILPIPDGSTLPLLIASLGMAAGAGLIDYLDLSAANQLDNLYNLVPGDSLVYRPGE
ncbi:MULTISPECIES: hypothetical protein [unclassified Burkholderia]|uniref:CIS tube protein n=1 Tax=unclassified Burkholderia TaxID=2613784 RepID=UPI00075DB062|nr:MULTISPECIES: hypothetical protein [unclassified Burkholderia]KVN11843.1 hypothetical protein WT08_00165 [Burkholderia sp. MSMB1552]KWZ50465.1 hypothetical protein WS92_24035 [Burkholderia sp. MSMB1588]